MVRLTGSSRVRPWRARRVAVLVTAGTTAAALLAGCSSGGSGSSAAPTGSPSASLTPSATASAPPTSSAPPESWSLAVSPKNSADDVRLDEPVTVKVTGGTLSGVTVTSEGDELAGTLDAAGKVWTSTEPLRSGRDYTVKGQARKADGSVQAVSSRFSTLTPDSTFKVNIIPGDDWEVGVGMPVVLYFSKKVKDREAVERSLTVTSTPAVSGDWHWMSSTEVQWRPAEYWPAGTKVVVKAGINGAEAAPGLWGSRTVTSTFSIGSAVISTVDVKNHTLTMTKDGKVVRTIPVTTGKRGYETRGGTKVIISKETSRVMDAATTGVDSTDPNYYRLNVKYAMRLTWSGEFLHAAPWSVGSQGHANVSHGCTGMSTSNARWLFDNSKVGDVVVYTNSKRELEWGNGWTAWNMDFAKWSAA